ncbi:MAG: hypothetical protein GYA33_14075 [Thermogutta sp.]|nr:hypothetical protein [Thermogutta sp.]
MPHDFPPQEMEQYDEYGERIERLAEMLHVSEQSLRMLKSRFLKRFRSLGRLGDADSEIP